MSKLTTLNFNLKEANQQTNHLKGVVRVAHERLQHWGSCQWIGSITLVHTKRELLYYYIASLFLVQVAKLKEKKEHLQLVIAKTCMEIREARKTEKKCDDAKYSDEQFINN